MLRKPKSRITIGTLVTAELKEKLVAEAERQYTSVSQLVRIMILEGLKAGVEVPTEPRRYELTLTPQEAETLHNAGYQLKLKVPPGARATSSNSEQPSPGGSADSGWTQLSLGA